MPQASSDLDLAEPFFCELFPDIVDKGITLQITIPLGHASSF